MNMLIVISIVLIFYVKLNQTIIYEAELGMRYRNEWDRVPAF